MSDTFKKLGSEETVHSTGAHRDTRIGKGAFHWMPWTALFLVSRIYENGNRMRGIRNWEKGMPISEYLDSALRHITRYMAGDRSESHLSQAIWNLLNAHQTAVWVRMGLRSKDLNDLPDHFTGKEPGQIDPLSPQEAEWLKPWGIELKTTIPMDVDTGKKWEDIKPGALEHVDYTKPVVDDEDGADEDETEEKPTTRRKFEIEEE